MVEPALDGSRTAHEQLRLLLFLGPEFTGFGDGAWGELTGEIRHTKFHRGAVVTDDHEIRNALNLLKWMLHGDVRTFQNHDYDEAAEWGALAEYPSRWFHSTAPHLSAAAASSSIDQRWSTSILSTSVYGWNRCTSPP